MTAVGSKFRARLVSLTLGIIGQAYVIGSSVEKSMYSTPLLASIRSLNMPTSSSTLFDWSCKLVVAVGKGAQLAHTRCLRITRLFRGRQPTGSVCR